ncbi:hypothetical protein SAMN02745218_00997 [Desulfofundulus australicus DSM 11792]|uniref:Uncharacterized protein n=1 Tax=Desulfofundulus australicus DSM 11792 TaxID=1121425 RepID=A0A1M4X537_9FIRM|nr:hypothetical protein [Desulfofundulus australicus]SHE88628.1 hypothetical protein SAMN02745218_00997 [Desulfofundulus australicus DSM 11792]
MPAKSITKKAGAAPKRLAVLLRCGTPVCQFKEKYGPRWEPRYLIYPHPLLLPKIAMAVVTANAGGSLWSYVQAWREKRRLA